MARSRSITDLDMGGISLNSRGLAELGKLLPQCKVLRRVSILTNMLHDGRVPIKLQTSFIEHMKAELPDCEVL